MSFCFSVSPPMALPTESFYAIVLPTDSEPTTVFEGYVPGPGLIKEFFEVFGLYLLLPKENLGIDF